MKLIKRAGKNFLKISFEEWIGIAKLAGYINDVIYVDENDDGSWEVTGYSDGRDVYLGVYSKEKIGNVIRRFRTHG